jgi:HTH-type transcriptional regulator/antitoxin HipB
LYELRKKHNLSQEELAEKLGVSRQAVSKWERSEASPDTDNLIALAKIYELSLDELIYGEKEEKDSLFCKCYDRLKSGIQRNPDVKKATSLFFDHRKEKVLLWDSNQILKSHRNARWHQSQKSLQKQVSKTST